MSRTLAQHDRQWLAAAPSDPLGVVPALLAACPGQTYAVHERDGEYAVGIGAAAEVVVDGTGGRLRRRNLAGVLDEITVGPATGSSPWASARQLLARLDGPWSAFGWATAEARSGVRVHLVVPAAMLHLTPGHARISGPDRALRERLAHTLAGQVDAQGPARPASPDDVEVDLEANAECYRDGVARAVRAIDQGRVNKVVLSRRVPISSPVDFPATYVAGRRRHEPARSVLLSQGETGLVGFCPETIVCVDPDGTFTSEPLAGTRGAPTGEAERARLADELRWDPKEVFEHAVSVRAMLEAFGPVAASVAVEELLGVRRRGGAQHLASRLSGRLADGSSAWDAFAAVFPTATGTGLPWSAALDLIGDLEPVPRGLYAGAALRVDHDGRFDSSLILRSVHRHGEQSWLQAGGGIVAGSDPDREVDETREKLATVTRSLVGAPRSFSGAA